MAVSFKIISKSVIRFIWEYIRKFASFLTTLVIISAFVITALFLMKPESVRLIARNERKTARIQVNNLPEGWVYVWDENIQDPDVTHGYYYYENAVPSGESTNALISWIKMNYEDTGDIQAHDVYVYAESVQTVDPNTGTEYTDWKNAWNSFSGTD